MTFAVGGRFETECELPAFVIVDVVLDFGVTGFSDAVSGDMVWEELLFVRDNKLSEQSLSGFFELWVGQ